MMLFQFPGFPDSRPVRPPLPIFDTIGHVLLVVGIAAAVLFFFGLLLSLSQSRIGSTIRPYAVRIGFGTGIVAAAGFLGAVVFLA